MEKGNYPVQGSKLLFRNCNVFQQESSTELSIFLGSTPTYLGSSNSKYEGEENTQGDTVKQEEVKHVGLIKRVLRGKDLALIRELCHYQRNSYLAIKYSVHCIGKIMVRTKSSERRRAPSMEQAKFPEGPTQTENLEVARIPEQLLASGGKAWES